MTLRSGNKKLLCSRPNNQQPTKNYSSPNKSLTDWSRLICNIVSASTWATESWRILTHFCACSDNGIELLTTTSSISEFVMCYWLKRIQNMQLTFGISVRTLRMWTGWKRNALNYSICSPMFKIILINSFQKVHQTTWFHVQTVPYHWRYDLMAFNVLFWY